LPRNLIKPWAHKAWITCTLDYQGVNGQRVKRQIFSPGSYSELFFLDEATAFTAGHRPRAQCRRERFNTFKAAWCKANRDRGDESAKLSVTELDKKTGLLESKPVNRCQWSVEGSLWHS